MFLNHFSIEEFSKPIESRFVLTHNETNILNCICLELTPKLEITKHIVNSIKKRDKNAFLTHSHVKWAMECIGFAFSLPIEHYSVISSAIEIYRAWLSLTSEERPDCIDEFEAFYQQEIVSHFSLLFQERGGDLHKHAELCKEVLNTLQSLCRQKELENRTWEHILSVFLMMSKGIFGSDSLLSREIIPLMFKVLFEVWLRSNTRQIELWEELQVCMAGWVKNIWVIHHWTSVELALTKNLIGLIYGKEHSKLKLIFKPLPKPFESEAESIQIVTSQEQNIFFWYQFWSILKNNTQARFPKKNSICTELVKSISSLTDEILYFAQQRNSDSKTEFLYSEQQHPNLTHLLENFNKIHQKFIDRVNRLPIPRINSILSFFGNWLFKYANCELAHCDSGRAKAVGAICRLFSSDLGPVDKDYAGKFYEMCLKLIKGAPQVVIQKFLKYSSVLFSCNLAGIRMLADKEYLLKMLSAQIRDRKNDVKIRKYCYSILGSFGMCLGGKIESVKCVQEILLEGIMSESEPSNFNRIVWITCAFFINVSTNVEILQSLALALVNRLKNITHDRMYSDLTAVISTIPFLIPQSSVSFNNFAQKIIVKICGYIRKRLHCHTEILSNLLFTLQKWLRCYSFVINDLELRTEVLEVLACTKLSDTAGELSEYLEDFILCTVGKFPVNLEVSGSIGVEMPFGILEKHFGHWQHYLIYSSVLLSVAGNSDEIIGILRNRIGRSIWKSKPVYVMEQQREKLEFSIETYSPYTNYIQPANIELDFDLSRSESEQQSKINHLLTTQIQTHYRGACGTLQLINPPESPIDHPLYARLILSQLGLFDYDEVTHIIESDQESISQIIADLDRFGSKEIYFLPVLYLSTTTSLDFLSHIDSFTQSFEQFLNQLGVKLNTQHMNLDFLAHISMHIDRYRTLLYSSDPSHEILSIVPCLSPEEMTLKEVVCSSSVVVLWNSRQDDSFCNFQANILKFPELEHKDCIILTPIKENLVKVNLHPNIELPGPLINNMVVPMAIIGKMVMYTIINIYGNSQDAVQTRKNRKYLLEQVEVLGKSGENFRRLNSLMDYAFGY